MSLGRRRAFSRHSERIPDLPFWGSLRVALSMIGSLELNTNEGFHMEAFGCCPPLELFKVLKGALFFYWTLIVWGSLAGGCCVRWMISPSSAPLDPLPLFLFLLAASLKETCVGVGVGGRGTTGIVGEAALAWVVSNASRSGVFFSSTVP